MTMRARSSLVVSVLASALVAALSACGDDAGVSKKTGDGSENGGAAGSKAGGSGAGGAKQPVGGGPGSADDLYGKVRVDGTVLLPGPTGDRVVPKETFFACAPDHGVYEAVAACCDAAGIGTEQAFTLTAQAVGNSAECAVFLQDSIDAGYVTVDAAKVAACEAQYAADIAAIRMCNGQRTLRSIASLSGSCEGAIVGKQAENAPCIDDRDCLTGLSCRGAAPGTPTQGTCQQPKALDELCGPTVPNPDAATAVAPIEGHPYCVADAYCEGRCRPILELGEDCEFDAACRSGICRDTCVSPEDIGGGDEGFQCYQDEDCLDGLYCMGSELEDEDFVCAKQLPAGSACTDETTNACVGGCVNNTCGLLCGLL
jgi:hypothetical protein